MKVEHLLVISDIFRFGVVDLLEVNSSFCRFPSSGHHNQHVMPVNHEPHVLLSHNYKFYWRQRVNLDTYIYYYPEFSVVEVVSYDRDDGRELNR